MDEIESRPNPNIWLAEYAQDFGVPKKELLVLAANNDPFNCGTPAQVEAAKWFAVIYERVGYRGIHLRRLHYRAYDAGVPNLEGETYPNTEPQWTALQNASRYARYLGRVNPEDFIDNRAPAPTLSVSSMSSMPQP
jgi:hypothetical protein